MADPKESDASQEDILALLRQYTPPSSGARAKDLLAKRYRILPAEPLSPFDSAFAKAYRVRDEQPEGPQVALYALVFENTVPLRQKNILALKDLHHSAMVRLFAEGVVELSTLSQERYAVVLEEPRGQPVMHFFLSDAPNPISEKLLVDRLLRPLADLLGQFAAAGISHNRINLKNVYLGADGFMLGECVSEPSGYSQDYLFEPIDRLLADKLGKNDFALAADCYALAVLTLHLMLGFRPFADVSKKSLIEDILIKGAYHALAIQWDLPASMQDFYRGMLNDLRRERWSPEHLKSWLNGRRYNIIMPSQASETARGFEFGGREYLSRKALAYAIGERWEEARSLLNDNKIARWVDGGIHKPETAEQIMRIVQGAGGESSRTERQGNEALSRIIMVLDPSGPIRLKDIACGIEGLGPLLAHTLLETNEQEDLQAISQIIDNDLPSFWGEQQKANADYSTTLWKVHKARGFIRLNALGFGMERCLYELNSSLPCQSPMLKKYCITELPDLLRALDEIAPSRVASEECVDRHIAAFVASKLEVGKELRIHELDGVPGMAQHPTLIGLKLLVRAQQKAGDVALAGLSYWMSIRLFPLLGKLHKRSLREELRTKLREAAGEGSLQKLASIVLNPDMFVADYNEFTQACDIYAGRENTIYELRHGPYLERRARIAGRGIAQTVAYTICLGTIYFTLKSYMHF